MLPLLRVIIDTGLQQHEHARARSRTQTHTRQPSSRHTPIRPCALTMDTCKCLCILLFVSVTRACGEYKVLPGCRIAADRVQHGASVEAARCAQCPRVSPAATVCEQQSDSAALECLQDEATRTQTINTAHTSRRSTVAVSTHWPAASAQPRTHNSIKG